MVIKERISRPTKILILYQQWSFIAQVVSKQNELFNTTNESVGVIVAPSKACLPIIPVLWNSNRVLSLIERQNLARFIRNLKVSPILIPSEGDVAPVVKQHILF